MAEEKIADQPIFIDFRPRRKLIEARLGRPLNPEETAIQNEIEAIATRSLIDRKTATEVIAELEQKGQPISESARSYFDTGQSAK